jgi:hypothetical protein
MELRTDAKSFRLKTWSKAIFISVFLCMWLSGMTAGLMAGACRNDRYEGAKKLRFCNISLTVGAWFDIFPSERAKRATIHLERGIALIQLGQEEKAREAFERALYDARAKQGSREQGLHQRILQLEDRQILALWETVVGSAP